MTADVFVAIGGLGLFLLGMTVLTDGLRDIAGPSLRRMLARFTKTPLRGAVAGAITTAIVQSSSATTVAAVGFVGAGLLTFPQGLGIVFGANIGTTVTGWLVALLGFRLDLGAIVAPLVVVGVLMKVFMGPRPAATGWALAGFAVLFIGIAGMQNGMGQFQGVVTPEDFPGDSFGGRLLLILIGMAITTVTQSSSAGVATALAALGAGAVSLPQATAMVIGMNVATTFTAALAAVGGSAAARRTAVAHFVYNLMCAVLAIALLDPYAAFAARWIGTDDPGGAQIALVGFHTLFNALGVIAILPFAGPFARLIEALVPERGSALTNRLDTRLLRDGDLAMTATAATLGDISGHVARTLASQLAVGSYQAEARLAEADRALETARRYIEQVPSGPPDGTLQAQHARAMHLLDHLRRLTHRCRQRDRIATLHRERRLGRLAGLLRNGAAGLAAAPPGEDTEVRLDRLRRLFRDQRHRYRDTTARLLAGGTIDTETALARLDSVRWLHRVAYHLWRVAHHLGRLDRDAHPEPLPVDARLELGPD